MNDTNPHLISEQDFARLLFQNQRTLTRFVVACGIANHSDAEDIFQETAVRLLENQTKYDAGREFLPWAKAFALHEIQRFHRKRAREGRILSEPVVQVLAARHAELAPVLDVRHSHLSDCLKKLPPRKLEMIRGYYFDEEDVGDLAHRYASTTGAVTREICRIRKTLEGCIDRKLQTE